MSIKIKVVNVVIASVITSSCGGGSGSSSTENLMQPESFTPTLPEDVTQTATISPTPTPVTTTPEPVVMITPTSETQEESCLSLSHRWGQTVVPLTSPAAANNEYTPAILLPLENKESLLSWKDAASNTIKIIRLDNTDQKTADLTSFSGLEIHDAVETANNNIALAVVDNAPDIYSAKYCKSDSTPENAVCGKMDLILLDKEGNLLKRTTVTNKQNVDSAGAQFIWWYGHTARLATDGSNVGIYYRSAMSTERPSDTSEIDIHAGDTLKFVNSNTGEPITGGWNWGCSHSWSVRFAYNGTNWAAVCHGDAYPNAMRIVRFNNIAASSNTINWLDATNPATRALGGLVVAEGGFWQSYIQTEEGQLQLKLTKFEDSLSSIGKVSTINIATQLDSTYPYRAYMTQFGDNQLLVGWKSGGKLVIANLDNSTGEVIEGPVTTSLSIDNFQDIKTTAEGDVIWAYSAGNNEIRVNRIKSCE